MREGPLRIGEWLFEPSLNQLSEAGKAVKLEPKATAVLLCLAEEPGQVVSREVLLGAAWPGVVVGDDSLTQVIVKLRKALGDAPEEPTYIQTVSKGGYRLVAPVVRNAAGEVTPPAPTGSALRPTGRKATWAAVAGGVALALAAGAAWWAGSERGSAVRPDPAVLEVIRAARAEKPTVAIEPFEVPGGDPLGQLLGRGIAADLVTDLSKAAELWVVVVAPADARTGKVPVRYAVSGTVQRIGGRLRLHIRLTDLESGRQLWAERYDRALAGIFEIQDELGLRILQVLPVKVSEAELQRVARRHTRNLEAYEYFQRGQLALHVRRKTENEVAREMFRRAVSLDAGFARAYAGLAQTYAADYRNQWAPDGTAALDRAHELARTAHQINPEVPETYWMLAYVDVHRHEHERALRHLASAVALNPSYADGYAFMAGIATGLGRPAEGVQLLRTAIRLRPESGYLYFMLLGRAYFFLGDLEQARLNLEHSLARNPEFLDARVYMAAVHVAAGDKAAAVWEAEEIRALQPGFTARQWLETNPTADAALRARLTQALGTLGL